MDLLWSLQKSALLKRSWSSYWCPTLFPILPGSSSVDCILCIRTFSECRNSLPCPSKGQHGGWEQSTDEHRQFWSMGSSLQFFRGSLEELEPVTYSSNLITDLNPVLLSKFYISSLHTTFWGHFLIKIPTPKSPFQVLLFEENSN